MNLRIGSLFSGIGGLELGLEAAGVGSVLWQVEQSAFCRAVLVRHWPGVQQYDDVRGLHGAALAPVDVLCGGFPCQDVSHAGTREGLDGKASGLWFEFERLVRELLPPIVVIENVAALLVRGIDTVLGALASCGYDAVWDCVPASAIGAPHRRDRLFIVAWRPDGVRALADRHGRGREVRGPDVADEAQPQGRALPDGRGETVADSERERRSNPQPSGQPRDRGSCGERPASRKPDRSSWARALESCVGVPTYGVPGRLVRVGAAQFPAWRGANQFAWEAPRTLYKVKHRKKKLRAMGNAVVPAVAEVVGRVVLEVLEAHRG